MAQLSEIGSTLNRRLLEIHARLLVGDPTATAEFAEIALEASETGFGLDFPQRTGRRSSKRCGC